MTRATTGAARIAIGLAACLPGMAAATSFQLIEHSAARLGNAFAGTASAGQDATTAVTNPAAMSLLDGQRLSASVAVLRFGGEFEDAGGTQATGPEGELDESEPVPALYYVAPLGRGATLGLALNAPFGMSTSYDADWRGRYHATDTSLTAHNLNATLALEASDRLTFAMGISYQTLEATLKNEIDSFVACQAVPGAPCTGLAPAERGQDSSLRIDADDDGVGADLSLLYRATDRTRIGLAYRQGIEHTLNGEADFTPSAACAGTACGAALGALGGDIEADLELPDVVTLSVTHALDGHWTLHGDIAWTEWSAIERVNIERVNGGGNVGALTLEYDDTVRYAVGASRHFGSTTWRVGLGYEAAPQTDPDHTTPRIPDGDRTQIAAGVSVDLGRGSWIDIGYMHVWVDETEIDNDSAQGHRLQGEFDIDADVLAAQANWRF